MSVQRSGGLLVLAVLLLPALAACGGAAVPGTSASVPAGAVATPSAASQLGGDGGVENPPIVDAKYTKGTFHADVTGGFTLTVDVPIDPIFSLTAEGSTVLSYEDPARGGQVGSVVLSADVNGMQVSTNDFYTGGSNADRNVCTVVVTQSDATRVAGTIECKGISGQVTSGTSPKDVTVDVRGTFDASP